MPDRYNQIDTQKNSVWWQAARMTILVLSYQVPHCHVARNIFYDNINAMAVILSIEADMTELWIQGEHSGLLMRIFSVGFWVCSQIV